MHGPLTRRAGGWLLAGLLWGITLASWAEPAATNVFPGFTALPKFAEQTLSLSNAPGVLIHINAPLATEFTPGKPVTVAFFTLPNGNTTAQTFGKVLQPGDDWHYDIQHIGAQTRFLRRLLPQETLVVVYLENTLKSWPSWRKAHGDAGIPAILEGVLKRFETHTPNVILSGHSGGGSFIFGYINSQTNIPDRVKRIAFLDSNYAYDTALHKDKLVQWLKAPDHYLCVLAYDDVPVRLNGKPIVSPAGGTWGKSHLMLQDLSTVFPFLSVSANDMQTHNALNGRIKLYLKENPKAAILHTVQVEKNGFIHCLVSGTPLENKGYAYFGDRAYTPFIPSESGLNLPAYTFETVRLTNCSVPINLAIARCTNTVPRHPVILMPGALKKDEIPAWSTNLVREGYALAAFQSEYPPDPDPARCPQWLVFDQRFAHSYVQGGYRAVLDATNVFAYLATRDDILPDKIGWLGSSSTGIPGLAVAARGPKLAAIVAFVSTGAYQQWLDTWHTNKLWSGKTPGLWPETLDLLRYDPIRHVDKMYPTAVLMVSGGLDTIVDPKTARAFTQAARPYYQADPHRLRLVVYEDCGHNLPADVVQMYAEHWFHLYMHPTRPAPPVVPPPASLQESVHRTQINAADHKKVVGAE